MSPSRREFLELGTLVMASSAVPLTSLAANASVNANIGSDTALYHTSAQSLEKHVGTEFVINRAGAPRVRMVLEAVKEFSRPESSRGSVGDAFAMHFRVVEGGSLAEGLYHLEHAAFGRTALTITPADTRGLLHSAVINHRKA